MPDLSREEVSVYIRCGMPPLDMYAQLDNVEKAYFIEENERVWRERIALLASCLADNPEQAEPIARLLDDAELLRDCAEMRMVGK